MSIEDVRTYLSQYGKENEIIELNTSSATVELAAQALHIEGKRIAKSLSFMGKEEALLVVCAGDCKIDNHNFKETFGVKASMLKPEQVPVYTNHEVGGVCPFAIPKGTRIFMDVSLKRFKTVFPACGSANSAIELTIEELYHIANCEGWVDVCKGWRSEK